MCVDCVEKFTDGEDILMTENMEALVELIHELYGTYPTGGPLHIQLDDYNLEDRFITYNHINADAIAPPDKMADMALCLELMELMMDMTVAQRATAVHKAHS